MSDKIFSAIAIVVGLAVFIGAVAYYGYLAWFKPSKFKEDQVKRVKDWWPYPNFYRSYFNSSGYLWWIRIMTIIIFLIIMFFLLLTLLGVSGLFP